MSTMLEQEWEAFVNDDKLLVFTAKAVGGIAGDTFAFYFVDGTGELVFSVAGTIATAGSATVRAMVNVDLADRLDAGATPPVVNGDYTWQFRRTNAGREDTLAAGTCSLSPSYRDLT